MTIATEVKLFFCAIYTGIAAYCFYQILILLRKFIPHSTVMINVEDLIYWIIMSVYIFHRIFVLMEGVIRWFFILGMIFGAVIMNEMKKRMSVVLLKWQKHLEKRKEKL